MNHPRSGLNAALASALLLFAVGVTPTNAKAQEARQFALRAAQRDLATFHTLAHDGKHALSKADVRGVVDLQARFDDIDRNRDGVITEAEMNRYVELTYGAPSRAAR